MAKKINSKHSKTTMAKKEEVVDGVSSVLETKNIDDGEKVLDPDLIAGDDVVVAGIEEDPAITEASEEEEDEDAIIDPEEMNPFGDKWEE